MDTATLTILLLFILFFASLMGIGIVANLTQSRSRAALKKVHSVEKQLVELRREIGELNTILRQHKKDAADSAFRASYESYLSRH